MKNFVLTEEMMMNAKTYMPLADKEELAKSIATLCIREADTAMQNWVGEKFLPLPHIKEENTATKEILELNAFLNFYFDVKIDGSKNSYEQYDFYMGGNIYNQLERFRSPAATIAADKREILRVKAFDIIADYKLLRKMIDREICNTLSSENDKLARFMAAIAVYANPESLKAALEQLKSLAAENETKTAEKAEINNE